MIIPQFETLITGYAQSEVGICDQFLPSTLYHALNNQIQELAVKNDLSPAGIGKGVQLREAISVRGDKIKWIAPTGQTEAEQSFMVFIKQFIHYLNATCFTGLNGSEFHFAVYEPKTFYQRHLDQFMYDHGRLFSLVIYLNDEWQEDDGGQLTVYLNNRTESILPIGNRAVFFKSDRTEHEVKPANRQRRSIAGWLKKTPFSEI